MTSATDVENRTPEEIQEHIAETRHALDDKLGKLGERLDPRVRLEAVKDRVAAASPGLAPWGAASAIAAGIWLAVRGWRAHRRPDDLYVSPDHPAIDHTYGRGGSDDSPYGF